MELYILNKDYEQIALIDEADSILWNKKYNDIGECEIYLPCTIEMLEILQEDYYVYRYDDDMFCQIKTIRIETNVEQGDYIIATAQDICTMLSGRIVWDAIVYSGNAGEFIQKVLNDNVINSNQSSRNIPNLIFDNSSYTDYFNDLITISVHTEDILQLIIATCKTYNIGFRMSFDIEAKKLVFKLYKGKDKSTTQSDEYIEFSPTFANILSSNYERDSSNFKNYAIVGAKDSDESLMYIPVSLDGTEPSGEARKELYVDATSTSREIKEAEMFRIFLNTPFTQTATYYSININGVEVITATKDGDKLLATDFTYQLMLEIIGRNALIEHNKTQTFSGEIDTIDTYEYKKDYDLGDIVKVENEYQISANARIIEILESEDSEHNYSVEPKFEY